MADIVSDVLLSFFCCCFYPPGGHPAGGNAAYHHHGAGNLAGRNFASRSRPASLQTVDLKVRMGCEGCERAVRQSLLNLRGVDSVEVNMRTEKVRVTGYVERGQVLRQVRRSGKKAEFWPTGGAPLRLTPPRGYYLRDDDSYRRSYSHRRHHGYGDRGTDPVSNIYNDDDDVNTCTIM